MKEKTETSQFVSNGGELLLDGEACMDLLRAALLKKARLRLRVKGFSMSPLIRDGDIATFAPLSGDEIEIGQVIAFVRPSDKKMVVHRLVGVREAAGLQYVPKGDNISRPDDPVTRADILACVETVERKGKTVSCGIGPERGWIAFLSRINLFCLLSFFWRLVPFPVRKKILG